jgi:DNA-binding CsgD family transcriptional regulator
MLEDVLRVLDTAYRLDVSESEWLTGIVSTIHSSLKKGPLKASRGGHGVVAFRYAINGEGRLSVSSSAAVDISEQFVSLLSHVPSGLPPSYVRGTFGRHLCSMASQAGGRAERKLSREQMSSLGDRDWRDLFVVNGLDPTGEGVWIGVPLVRMTRVSPEVVTCWTKVAVHIAAALRLRRRLQGQSSSDRAEALIEPRGAIATACGAATTKEARRALVDSVRTLERIRAPAKRGSSARSLVGWKGLVDARWTLIDHFETDGRRYLVAQRNDVIARDISALTEREQQVLAFATLRHTNKLIAYELGISPSTVGVFLHHAARKLKASTRRQLLATFEQLSGRGGDS